MAKKKKESGYEAGGIAFTGSVLIGIGLGLLYGRPDVGVMLGLGVGFILMALIKAFSKN